MYIIYESNKQQTKECKMQVTEFCAKEGITIEQYRKYSYDFLQGEGYVNGKSCNTLFDYIKEVRKPVWGKCREPWQKGDFDCDYMA
jgi:hypothetical protein